MDERNIYIASDFRQRDWASPERLADSLRRFESNNLRVRMIDCASQPQANLAVTDLTPVQDVWVAGVPVVVRATIKNYSPNTVKNVTLACRVIRYGETVVAVDPTQRLSGTIDPLPAIVIESLAAGAEITKTFQVFINELGTHAIEVELPQDALEIDNKRACTLPLSDVERVLVIDSDPDQQAAYTIAAALDPGSQVRIGAVPDLETAWISTDRHARNIGHVSGRLSDRPCRDDGLHCDGSRAVCSRRRRFGTVYRRVRQRRKLQQTVALPKPSLAPRGPGQSRCVTRWWFTKGR